MENLVVAIVTYSRSVVEWRGENVLAGMANVTVGFVGSPLSPSSGRLSPSFMVGWSGHQSESPGWYG